MTRRLSHLCHLVAAGTLAMSLAACGSAPAPRPIVTPFASDQPDSGAMCAAYQKRNGIVHCTQLFAGNNPIHLARDPADRQRYGAVNRSGSAFHTRTGDLPISAKADKQLREGISSGHAPYATTIYLATIANGTVTAVQPIADIDENAILATTFAGRAMEGTIGTLAGPGEYTTATTLPIRIQLATKPVDGALSATILNATGVVRAAGGACLPPLARQPANPLVGSFTATIHIERIPAMHGAFNDELILGWNHDSSNMGPGYYPSVATLLGGDPLEKEWTTLIHGTPTAGPAVDLHLVTGGGEAC